jgi:putative phosphonate metabolism protein
LDQSIQEVKPVRYAIYFAPPADDRLSLAASRWLGRDAFNGGAVALPEIPALEREQQSARTAEPRRYGFHGTLKAPFALAPDRSEAELIAAFDEFAAEIEPFEVPKITLHQLGPFFALVPTEDCIPLRDLAAQTVRRFEPFRAPPSETDLARRNPEKLTERQREYLTNWGYPYVFEEFQFHLTLTGPVPEEMRGVMRETLEVAFAEFIGKPLVIETVALFVEPSRGAPFTVHSLLPLGSASTRKIA